MKRLAYRSFVSGSLALGSLALGGGSLALSACDTGPPVRTASGELIASISYEERFPLSNDAHDVTFHGDRLRRVAEMMEKSGALALKGDFAASGVLDKSTLVVTVTTSNAQARKIVMKNCAEPHVCAFFAEAVKGGLAERAPVVCRDAVACSTK